MTRSKAKIITAGIALAVVTAIAFRVESRNSGSWETADLNSAALAKLPPQVAIKQSTFSGGSRRLRGTNHRIVELGVTVSDIVAVAYGHSPARTVFAVEIPTNRYDFICTLSKEPLQRELKMQFGLIGRHETRPADALLLRVKSPLAPGLMPAKNPRGPRSVDDGPGCFSGVNISAQILAALFEHQLGVPVMDQTGSRNKNFDVNLAWKDSEDLKQVVLDQLGLELVPTNMPVEMVVIERAK